MLDFILFVMIIVDALNVHEIFFPSSRDVLDKYAFDESKNENMYYRHIVNASIISFIVFLVWIRIISVLITTK